jgi:hypothetical protein
MFVNEIAQASSHMLKKNVIVFNGIQYPRIIQYYSISRITCRHASSPRATRTTNDSLNCT